MSKWVRMEIESGRLMMFILGWLIGLLSGVGLSIMFVAWVWMKLVRRGEVAIKDRDGIWQGKNLPRSFTVAENGD